MDNKYTVLSLFSGGMGLDLGLHYTNRFRLLACLEKNHACCETIRHNRQSGRIDQSIKLYEGDITDISPLQVLSDLQLKPGDLDLIVGGPPCQSFSTAGKRGTIQDPRGTMLWQFLHYVEVMKPKFFLMENVRGLLSAALQHRPIADRPNKGGKPLTPDEEPGSVVRLFADELRSISGASYHLDCFEVNSVNYGAPQIRERVLFIGNRYNVVTDFPVPTHSSRSSESEKDFQITLFDDKEGVRNLPWRTLRDVIGDLNESEPIILDFSPRKKKYLSMVPEGSNWRSLPVDIQKESMGKAWYAKGGRSGWWRRLTFDLPCPTLMTMPNHASTSLCHPKETRALSLKEYARIQEFPDDWEFLGTVSEQYSQVGNAVPTRLGKVSGDVISIYLDQLHARKWQPHENIPDKYRIIYLQSHVRTRQWFKGGKTFVWKDGDTNNKASYAVSKTIKKVKNMA